MCDSITTVLSEWLVRIQEIIPSCKLKDTEKLLYSTSCFLFVSVFFRHYSFRLLFDTELQYNYFHFLYYQSKVGAPY